MVTFLEEIIWPTFWHHVQFLINVRITRWPLGHKTADITPIFLSFVLQAALALCALFCAHGAILHLSLIYKGSLFTFVHFGLFCSALCKRALFSAPARIPGHVRISNIRSLFMHSEHLCRFYDTTKLMFCISSSACALWPHARHGARGDLSCHLTRLFL